MFGLDNKIFWKHFNLIRHEINGGKLSLFEHDSKFSCIRNF